MRMKGIKAWKTMPVVLFIVVSLAFLSASDAAAQSLEPTTTPSIAGTQGDNGWYRSDVVVTLVAKGPINFGINRTEYGFSSNQSTWKLYTGPINVTNEGITTIYYRSIDNASHVESTKVTTIYMDKTPPAIRAVMTPAPNAKGWVNKDVQLYYEVSDDVSGVAQRPSNETLTNEGTYSTLSGTATDHAGNTATFKVPAFSIDKTLPAIGSLSSTGNTYVEEYVTVSTQVAEANLDRIVFDWGDGIGSQGTFNNNVARGMHAYKRPGTYTFNLTVIDLADNAVKTTGSVSILSYAGSATPTPTPVPSVTPTPTQVPLPSPTAAPTPSAGLVLSAIGLTMAGCLLACLRKNR